MLDKCGVLIRSGPGKKFVGHVKSTVSCVDKLDDMQIQSICSKCDWFL